MKATRSCTVAECEREHWAKGFCSPHYKRWKKNGDPGTGSIGQPVYSVEGCGHRATAKGWCSTHYRRWNRDGDPGPADIRRQAKESTGCSVEGCSRSARARGWCMRHYQRWHTNGDPGLAEIENRPYRKCSLVDCDRDHYAKNLCLEHYKDAKPGCSFDGCESKQRMYGLCNGHAQQKNAGKALTPLLKRRKFGAPEDRDNQGRKFCHYCDRWLTVDNYSAKSERPDGLRTICKECVLEQHWVQTYGITRERYEVILAAQGGVCAVCKVEKQPNGRKLYIDHDHSCCQGGRSCGSCVRGLLCHACNAAAGLLGDDLSRIEALAGYLRSFGGVSSLPQR